ncbi:hypothetical protein [Chondrinema litorale]|uniref:hypothetical protein n=1 Tax=Chondrinema litorale TaxID=2994555 RepID=UPI0025432066|nr:hypothetical protein [Chondrinema litorale]UZR94748.1 hypothetical protein OQ292_02820 [Chondrinema litorale]
MKKILTLLFLLSYCLLATAQDDIEAKLENARVLLDENKYKEAINQIEKLPKKGEYAEEVKELHGKAYLGYANQLVRSKDKTEYDIAVKYVDKYIKLYKKDTSLTAAKKIELYKQVAGELFYNTKDFQSSARIYKDIQKLNKKKNNSDAAINEDAYSKIAQCYLELGNYSAARKNYYKAYGYDVDIKELADAKYCDRNDVEAARLYRLSRHYSKLNDKNGYDVQIARSYFRAKDNEKALEWYGKFLSEKDITLLDEKIEVVNFNEKCEEITSSPYKYLTDNYEILEIDIFNYAQALLNENGKYLSAKDLFEKFTFVMQEDPNIDRANFLEEQTYVLRKLTSAGVNRDQSSEFSPTFYKKDSVIFVSDRNLEGEKVKTLNGEQRSTLDLYITKLDSADYFGFDTSLTQAVATNDSISGSTRKFINYTRSKKYNEGPMVFLPGRWDKFIFTGNTYLDISNVKIKGKKEINTLKLFLAEQDSVGNWSVQKINFTGDNAFLYNSEDYSIGHPSISTDGKKIYFSSDAPIPGSFGNSDIYVADFDIDKLQFSNAENLGASINTEGNEVFPFLHTSSEEQKTLYFSSNKPESIGGLDIYKSAYLEDVWSTPLNMKNDEDTLNSVNSIKDDFGFVLNKEGNFGYFSSDRDSTDDIFMFRTLKIQVSVCDQKTQLPLENANVALFPVEGRRLGPKTTNADGKTMFSSFALDTEYTVFASFEGYRPAKANLITNLSEVPADGIFKVSLCLEKSPEAELIILANVKSEQQIFINFNKEVTELNESTPISANNLYELFYSENGNFLVDTDQGPNITLQFFNDELIELKGMELQENQERLIELFRRSGILVKDVTTIRNIRYNFATNEFTKGKGEIVNPEEEFTKLATVMNRYDHLLLKISSHTDKCPLNGGYDNQALSRRRNMAAREFIVNNFPDYNINVNRIKECAYTYQFPVDTTYNEPDNCKNDFNRRTEFKLLYRGRQDYTMDMICDPSVLEYVGKPELKSNRKRKRKIEGE